MALPRASFQSVEGIVVKFHETGTFPEAIEAFLKYSCDLYDLVSEGYFEKHINRSSTYTVAVSYSSGENLPSSVFVVNAS